jgi:DNA-directed RNA polymerase subunit H (RpoH/RPB5)
MEPTIAKSYDTISYNLREAGFTHEPIPEDMELPVFTATHPNGDRVFVLYHLERMSKNTLDNLVLNITDKKDTDIIYIVAGSHPLDNLRSQLKSDNSQQPYIIVTNLWSHQFRILEHKYVPKHVILTDKEIVDFKTTYNIKDNSQIPEISRFDPVAMAIFMKPGQICKILRNEKATMSDYFYRVCI